MQTKVFDRSDTFFGVCEAVGQDFGFNAQWLRLVLCVGLLWNPLAMVGAYALLGAGVLASRLIFPSKPAASVVVAPAVEMEPEPMRLAA